MNKISGFCLTRSSLANTADALGRAAVLTVLEQNRLQAHKSNQALDVNGGDHGPPRTSMNCS